MLKVKNRILSDQKMDTLVFSSGAIKKTPVEIHVESLPVSEHNTMNRITDRDG